MKIGNLEVYGVIYKITNNVDGKVYIGQTTNKNGIRGRYRIAKKRSLIEGVYIYHRGRRKTDKRGFNVHLFYSIEKHGFDNFEVIEIFDIAFSKDELDIKERTWIVIFKSTNSDFGYNNQKGGVGGKNNLASVEKSKNTQIKNAHTRFINQLEIPSLRIINTYPSIASATKALGLSRSSIKNVLNPTYKAITAGGYAWQYTDLPNMKYLDKDLNMLFKSNEEEINEKIIDMYNQRYTYKYIANELNIPEDRIHKLVKRKALCRENPLKHEAKIKRSQIIKLYIEGRSNREIRDITSYSKSIVEKAIEKYTKGIVDIDGVYIKNN